MGVTSSRPYFPGETPVTRMGNWCAAQCSGRRDFGCDLQRWLDLGGLSLASGRWPLADGEVLDAPSAATLEALAVRGEIHFAF